MELLVRLYSDKPSKLGIWYPHEYAAVKAYEQLLDRNRNEKLSVSIEIVKRHLRITLHSSFSGTSTVYKDIEYRHEHLKKLLTHFSHDMPMHFVHVFTRANTMLIAKPYRTNEFLPVSSVSLVGQEGGV